MMPALDTRQIARQTVQRTLGTRSGDLQATLARYRADPVVFAQEVLHFEPAPYQAEIMREFVARRRAAVRGPHGLGKTAMIAALILWAVATAEVDTKIVTTAGAWRQLEFYLWPEIRKWAARGAWHSIGLPLRLDKEILVLQIKTDKALAFAAASNQPGLIEGAHASRIFYFFDEAKSIDAAIWDAAEGAFSAGVAYAFAGSTPGDTSGRFYEIHKHGKGLEDWWTRHVTLEEAIAAGRISREWAEQRKAQWGETSAVYQNRVLGEFADSGEDNVIPLSWVELAIERWHAAQGKGEGDTSYGVDPAYKGEDKTTVARLVGTVLEAISAYAKDDTMQTAGRVAASVDPAVPVAIDVIGVGAGVFDRLRELGYNVLPVNVSEKTTLTDASGQIGFMNLRAAVWWVMRERLDPNGDAPAALPPDDHLIGDLTAPTWKYTSAGKIAVESKDDIRARLGRSTDYADAWGLAEYAKLHAHRSLFFFG